MALPLHSVFINHSINVKQLLAKNSLNLGFIMNSREGSLTVSRSGYRPFQVYRSNVLALLKY